MTAATAADVKAAEAAAVTVTEPAEEDGPSRAAVADLRARGLRVFGEPTASRGPSEGQRWVYFLSPWGMQFELVSYPAGKAFDRDPRAFG